MSGISDYGNFGPQTPNQTTGPGSSDPTAPAPHSSHSHSTIQQSELEILELLLVAGIPILIPPEINGNAAAGSNSGVNSVSAASIQMLVEEKKHEIISKMWDSYIQNIREIADRAKEEDIGNRQSMQISRDPNLLSNTSLIS